MLLRLQRAYHNTETTRNDFLAVMEPEPAANAG
jgi:hypothetical protein